MIEEMKKRNDDRKSEGENIKKIGSKVNGDEMIKEGNKKLKKRISIRKRIKSLGGKEERKEIKLKMEND